MVRKQQKQATQGWKEELCLTRKNCAGSVDMFFFFQAEDGIRDVAVTGVQTCALPISAECPNNGRAGADLTRVTGGSSSPIVGEPRPGVPLADSCGADAQAALIVDLVGVLTVEEPSIRRLLELLYHRLRDAAALRFVGVYSPGVEQNRSMLVAGDTAAVTETDLVLAAEVYRVGRPRTTGTVQRMSVPLRRGGQTLGVLVLAGRRLTSLRPDVVDAVALHLASTLQVLGEERDRQSIARTARAIHRLFEEGMV